MSITITPFTVGELCDGAAWTVPDVDALATHIAIVAAGQAYQLENILLAAGLPKVEASKAARAEAMKLLTVEEGDPFHRDGWIFQVMSWIAAHHNAENSIIRTPHMIKALKGFDGLQVVISTEDGSVQNVIIFEDKATERPREVIRNDVWPDFVALESGEKEHVLVSEITTLLRIGGYVDAPAIVKNVIWEKSRVFKASITVSETHSNASGRNRLFAGYDKTVSGDKSRRKGDTFFVDGLRPWMDALAEKAKAILSTSGTTHV